MRGQLDTDTHEAMGRMANALTSAKEFIEEGDGAVVIFDGAGTKSVPELESEEIESSSVPLLGENRNHPSLHAYASVGYQVITF